ncbi:hypothetical protein O0I10_012101 [Lichtheimia ornata]|uniref:Uncharacterized protein n=1 Tax=Lichtheimia ornata TaxID=688661 RepID=A0AAD7URU4_9FUNG|nr:uncharacterized protein O0I10_012101 [Lichtheimia ornata]KAJ8652287.1 hypothetical protein O0I10_012101 [Lichtheimia ornata]
MVTNLITLITKATRHKELLFILLAGHIYRLGYRGERPFPSIGGVTYEGHLSSLVKHSGHGNKAQGLLFLLFDEAIRCDAAIIFDPLAYGPACFSSWRSSLRYDTWLWHQDAADHALVLLPLWWQQHHNEDLAYCTLYPTKNDTYGTAMALRKALTSQTTQLLWLQLRRSIPMASRMDYHKGPLDTGGIYHLN